MRRLVTAVVVALMFAVGAVPASATAEPGMCQVENGRLDWGVKKEFRDYIAGPVANGSWLEGGGASFQGGRFRWASASGTLDRIAGTGLVGFIGSVTFSGHAGAVTRTLANPELQFVSPTTVYLLVDVSGVMSDGTKVASPGVQFAALTLPPGALDTPGRTLALVDIPAVLTAQGAAVFGGYAAGDPLDPVSIAISLACSSTAAASASPTASSPMSPGLLTWLVLALGVIAIILVLIGLVFLRRRAS